MVQTKKTTFGLEFLHLAYVKKLQNKHLTKKFKRLVHIVDLFCLWSLQLFKSY